MTVDRVDPESQPAPGLRLLIVTDYLFERGGIYSHLVSLEAGLEHERHEVRFLSSAAPGQQATQSGWTFDALKERGALFRLAQCYNPRSARALRRAIRLFRPDVVHFHYIFNQCSPSVILAAAAMKVPCVLTVHGFEMVHSNPIVARAGPLRYQVDDIETANIGTLSAPVYLYKLLKFKLYKRAFRRLDAFITPSDFAREQLSADEQAKAHVVPHGVAPFGASPISSWNDLLFVGRLIEGKGVATLLRALPQVLAACPGTVLRIVGDGEERDRLARLVQELRLAGSVHFLGRLSHAEVGHQMEGCTLLVLPTVRPETFSVTGMEALTVGRPVVATNIGAVREWLVSEPVSGRLVEPNDPEGLAEAIITLLHDRDSLQRMGGLAPRKAAAYSEARMVSQTVAVYRGILQESKGVRSAP